MCRNIKTLYNFEPPAKCAEILAASRQFVRKISGSTKPSKANELAFEQAVEDVATTVRKLMASLVTTAPAKDREVEAAKARARIEQRFSAWQLSLTITLRANNLTEIGSKACDAQYNLSEE
jgi:hypothetical protein